MKRIECSQIQPPEAQEMARDNHARLVLDGRPINAGDVLEALFPAGWKTISIEMKWSERSPQCWYIASPKEAQGYDLQGLFAKWK